MGLWMVCVPMRQSGSCWCTYWGTFLSNQVATIWQIPWFLGLPISHWCLWLWVGFRFVAATMTRWSQVQLHRMSFIRKGIWRYCRFLRAYVCLILRCLQVLTRYAIYLPTWHCVSISYLMRRFRWLVWVGFWGLYLHSTYCFRSLFLCSTISGEDGFLC